MTKLRIKCVETDLLGCNFPSSTPLSILPSVTGISGYFFHVINTCILVLDVYCVTRIIYRVSWVVMALYFVLYSEDYIPVVIQHTEFCQVKVPMQ